ncbi:glutamate synthase central domain-containing protein [Staphylococcus aureus]|uniref:glutamate synthase central domain-containing protein n=1 Tax=Staphylococcus aureus TaxID=1280 RepID=UPI001C83FCBE
MHAQANFRKGIEKGLLKVLSKMGISTVRLFTCKCCACNRCGTPSPHKNWFAY